MKFSAYPVACIALSAAISVLASCSGSAPGSHLTASGLDPDNFTSVYRGDSTALYTLVNGSGMEVCITNFGGRVVSLSVPDRNGHLVDVALGFDSIADYYPENNLTDFGASIGRYANRIDQGRFVLDGDTIRLPRNNYGHCLHGGGEMGSLGWQYRTYNARQYGDSLLVLSLKSPDGDNGFPGNVTAEVRYLLRDDNALDITFSAVTDSPTVVNMTNHTYFNLSGNPSAGIREDSLLINASAFTPVDSTFMTSGEIRPVIGTPMDFTSFKAIGADIDNFDDVQIRNARGYDHNWVLDTAGDDSQIAASLYSPASGIRMDLYTDEPGVQIYSGNFLDGSVIGKQGVKYGRNASVCLETQHYPDSPNKPQWPSVVLRSGERYNSHCVYRFSVVD